MQHNNVNDLIAGIIIPAFTVDIVLPESFPAKYRKAVVRAAEQCTVKRHLLNPPTVTVRVAG